MPALPHQLLSRAASAVSSGDSQSYSSAILLAFFSFVIMLLIIPPMLWHFRNRNIGATALVGWTVILLLLTFINAVLWPNDNINSWYNGVGLCDIEVKLQVASEVARPASLACILRALAAVLDTDRATLIKTKAQRRRNYIIDLSWCLGFPLLQMLFHYIVQYRRYYLYGISGCIPAISFSLVTVFLLGLPPLLWTLIDAYYAVLILIRLYRYRLIFSSILANNNTTKSRFMRLYIICIIWVSGYIPVECYVLYSNLVTFDITPYSWSAVHDPENWKKIIMVPSGGKIMYDRWIWLSCGFLVFVFFGFGKDAVNMYRTGLLAIGMGTIFPALRQDYRGSVAATISSYGSRARMTFKGMRSTSNSTWTSASKESYATASTDPLSPKKEPYPPTIEESVSARGTAPKHILDCSSGSISNRILSAFRPMKSTRSPNTDLLPLANTSGQQATVQSTVTAGPQSPTLTDHTRTISPDKMLMRTEVRRGSEHELPPAASPN